MVYDLIVKIGEKAEALESLPRRAITEARGRGLNYQQMAIEFNGKIRRNGKRPWTASNVMKTWSKLNRLERDRKRKGSMSTKQSGAVVLKKSA